MDPMAGAGAEVVAMDPMAGAGAEVVARAPMARALAVEMDWVAKHWLKGNEDG